jgi:hypothetical protein
MLDVINGLLRRLALHWCFQNRWVGVASDIELCAILLLVHIDTGTEDSQIGVVGPLGGFPVCQGCHGILLPEERSTELFDFRHFWVFVKQKKI